MAEELLKAYAEVDEILSLMENKYIEKIPLKVRNMFKENRLKGYMPQISANISLDEQKLQNKTYSILAMLNLNYWCENENEKRELIAIYAENDKKREEELRKKYNPDNLFKQKKNREENKNAQENMAIIEYKENNFFKKIINKIKMLFKKNK